MNDVVAKIIGTLLGLAFVALMLYGSIRFVEITEIWDSQYKHIQIYSEKYPEVKVITCEAMSDGKITNWEYRDIYNLIENLREHKERESLKDLCK